MPEPLFMIIIITLLIAASGFFSLFNQALKIAKTAEHPDRYLTVSRFWMSVLRTVAAMLAGLSLQLTVLQSAERSIDVWLYIAACTAVLVFAILFFSSFIPRLIVRRAPERIVKAFLPLIKVFALPLRPFLFLIRIAGERLRLALFSKTEQQGITEDELRHALIEGEKSGIVESKERTMVEGVFYLGDRSLGTFMTHRSEIQWLDINTAPQDIRAKVLEYREQRCFPVADGTLDAIIGAAYLEDIILDLAADSPAGLRAIMKKALFAPETMPALKAFESFRRGKVNFLFVMDEYGGFAGMVSARDLMEEIVGELTAPADAEEEAKQQEDGSWIADGGLNIDDAATLFSLPGLAASGDYYTLAGFVLSLAEELPHAGDCFTYQDCAFTVLDMDGNRINRIAVKKIVSE